MLCRRLRASFEPLDDCGISLAGIGSTKLQSAPSHTQSGDFESILEDEKRGGGHAGCAHGGGVSTFKPLLPRYLNKH